MVGEIRLANGSDAEEIAAIYSHFVLNTPVSFEAEAPDVDEIRRRIASILVEYPWLICEIDGRVAGYAYASQHRTRHHYRWSVDVTVYVNEAYRRRGVGRALYTALLAIVPLQGYVSAFAGITLPNAGSVGLHEAMGFTPVGIYRNVGFKLGKWHDVGWWQRQLVNTLAEPGELLALSAVIDTSGWTAGIAKGRSVLGC